jgi:serine/threonine-protein kinase
MSDEPRAADGAPAPGTVIAEKYRVVGVIGSGGMGCLVKAEHLLMKKPVAIKFVLASRSGSARQRLIREARAAQALSSENVVRVFDLGVHEGAPYIVMELLEGADLAAQLAARGPLAIDAAVDVVLEACVGVSEAHALGIIHRDIKPANLFATARLVKVLDFGISKVPESVLDEDCAKTSESDVLGTPFYASPEQLRNPANVDARTDVWALAVTLFHLLSGEHPFPGSTPREVMAAIFADAPTKLEKLRPEVPEDLCAAIAAALTKRPEQRTPTVAAFVQALLPHASKRGRLAGERIAAMETGAPVVVPIPNAPERALGNTDAGVCSTLPETQEPPASILKSAASRMRSGVPLAAVFVIAGLVGAGWLMRRAQVVESHMARTVAAPPLTMKSAAPKKTAATASAPAPPPPSKPTSRASRPAPSASAVPPPEPRRDIDGVPIVE